MVSVKEILRKKKKPNNVIKPTALVIDALKMLNSVEPKAESVNMILADLKTLESQYAALNIDEQIKNNKANLVLSDKNLVEITNTVEKIRQSITN